MNEEEWKEIAKKIAEYVDKAFERKVDLLLKQPWSYGQVKSIDFSGDPDACDTLWCEIDGQTEQVPVWALSSCDAGIGDYVLIVAVNDYSGDRVAITTSRKAGTPAQPTGLTVDSQSIVIDNSGERWVVVEVSWTDAQGADLYEIAYARKQ